MQFFYTVRQGDTLNHIAKRWELPVKSLIAANNLMPPYTLSMGQQLSIPPGVDMYRVQSGDSVYRISQHYGVPVAVIAEGNQANAAIYSSCRAIIKNSTWCSLLCCSVR